jgi:hypothetical protein
MEAELEQLIKMCSDRNIKVIIMLSQRLGDRYEYLIPLYNRLPEENKVSFADPSAYPFLNDRENLFDLAHLNRNGSILFTKVFGDIFIQKVEAQE